MKKSQSILLVFLYVCALMLAAVSVAAAATDTPDMEISGGVLWHYYGDETTVTIPEDVTTVRAGAFYESKVQVVIVPHDVILRSNAFTDAYYLTDIYIYSKDITHLRSLYSGAMCAHEQLACTDPTCSSQYSGIFTTFLTSVDTHADKYVSKTLTIHGYKGSTVEQFVELVNANPTLFNCPQALVFKAIEEEPTVPPVEEEKPKPEEESVPKADVHMKGTKGTSLYIADLYGITYPRHVYMGVGSYYILELGNLTEGYSYTIPAQHFSTGTLNTETGEFKALRPGTVTVKIQLVFPDGRRANISCKIYIKGD